MKTLLLLLVTIVALSNAANILYLSNVPSPSHFIWCKSILYALHERGHNITALSGDTETSKANLTFLHLDQMYPTLYNGTKELDFLEFGRFTPIQLFRLYSEWSEKACIGAVNSKGFKSLLNYPDDFKVSKKKGN